MIVTKTMLKNLFACSDAMETRKNKVKMPFVIILGIFLPFPKLLILSFNTAPREDQHQTFVIS